MMLHLIARALALVLLALCGARAEIRWCQTEVYDPRVTPDGWVLYDDQFMTCLRCSNTSAALMNTNKLDRYECCQGRIVLKGTCVNQGIGTLCAGGVKCDGIKQCPNGEDEVGCNVCNNTARFTCTQHADSKPCITNDKVCDGTKDCAEGLDETGCSWHGGWCDGFLCGKPHERCIPKSQVCDGTKQCMDGSDEYNCRYCFMQFRCSVYQRADPLASVPRETANTTTAQCVGSFRVCDGVRDCNNSIDEQGCYRWREWSLWSACNTPFQCTRVRQRICVNKFGAEVFPSSCYDVEDYHLPGGQSGTEIEAQICPECITTTASTTTTTVSTTRASTAVEISSTTSPPTTAVASTQRDATTALTGGATHSPLSSTASKALTLGTTSFPSTSASSEALTSSSTNPSTSAPSEATTSGSTNFPSTSAPTTDAIISSSTNPTLPSASTVAITSSSTNSRSTSAPTEAITISSATSPTATTVTETLPSSTFALTSASTDSPSTATASAVPTTGQTSPPRDTALPASTLTSLLTSTAAAGGSSTPSDATSAHTSSSSQVPMASSPHTSAAIASSQTTYTPTGSGDWESTLPQSQSTVSEGYNVTSNVTEATPSPRRPLSSVISLSLIISIVVVSALILMAVICSLVFCCSEQRRKRGKWVPRRRYKERREFSVPQMYHDVSLEDVREGDVKDAPTPKPMKSFVSQAAVDSGIDESNSTTSTLEHGATQRPNSPPSTHDSSTLSSASASSASGSLRSHGPSPLFRSPSDLPPPPPHLYHNDV